MPRWWVVGCGARFGHATSNCQNTRVVRVRRVIWTFYNTEACLTAFWKCYQNERERERERVGKRARQKERGTTKQSTVVSGISPRCVNMQRLDPHTDTHTETHASALKCLLAIRRIYGYYGNVVQVQATAPGCCWCVVPPWTLYGLWNVQVFNRFFQSLN